jgi:hypothetical protein
MLRPLVAVALLAALAFAGCSSSPSYNSGSSGGTTGSATSGTGSASAYVKDAPGSDFKEVHVVFTEVAVHRSGNGTMDNGTMGNMTMGNGTSMPGMSDNGTGNGTDGGWTVVFSDAAGVDVDLLNTTGARAAFLGEANLTAGHYEQVRITVQSAYGIAQDGTRSNITVSSGTLKSVRSFDVVAGNETRITIDIDLSHSLHQTGQGWRMTPVIGKTTAAVVDGRSSGRDVDHPGDVRDVPESA